MDAAPVPATADGMALVETRPAALGTGTPAPQQGNFPAAVAAQRPEVVVGGAFAGGVLLALILKRLAR
jgi:hypothetical protein